ncbi:MAG: TRAP transporter substrate-binding protein DctP [Burkholderiaceae bacterium]
MKLHLFKSLTMAGALALQVSPGLAEQTHQFNLANEFAAGTLPAQSEQRFVELVDKKSNGMIKITPHFGGALGYKSRDQFMAVRDGAVALGSAPFDKFVGLDPIFTLQSLPFLTPTIEKTRALFEIARPYYETAFNKANQTLLLGEPWTPQGIWAKKQFTSVADLEGLKVRSYDATGTKTLKRAGAAPVQLAGSDVVPALGTNTIQAVLTSDESGVSGRYWEHGAKYFNFLGYTMGISAVTMNLDAFNKLSKAQQQTLREAAKEAEAQAWEVAMKRTDHNKQIMAKHDAVYVSDVPQAVIDHLKKAGAPELENWKKQMGPVVTRSWASWKSEAGSARADMKTFQWLALSLSRAAARLSALILVAMVVHVLVEIFLRTFLDTSTFALDEFVGYEVAAMAFLALGYSLEKGSLIRVTLLLDPLRNRPRGRRLVELFCALATLAATAIPAIYFWRSIHLAWTRGYTTGTITDLPQWVPEVFVFVGLVIFWIQLLAYTIRVWRNEVDLNATAESVRDT